MTGGRKLAMGLAAAVPMIGVTAVAAFVASRTATARHTDFDSLPFVLRVPALSESEWLAVGICLLVIALLQMALAALFFLHVLAEPRLAPVHKALWGIGMLLLGEVLLPIYWLRYIYRDPAPRARNMRAQLDARYPIDR